MASEDEPSKGDAQVVERLTWAGAEWRAAAAALDKAAEERDRAIVEATDRGFSRRKVGAAVGLTAGRVQQILDRRRI